MSVPVSENQQNQKWALFAKAISSERSAKLGFDVLFNAERRKNNFSSFTQSYKAGNQSSLTPLIRAVVQPLCLMLAMVISPILASAVVDITNPVVTPPANLTVAASSATGTIATVAPALTSYLTAHDPASWQKSDGWSNGGMFQVGWRADHVSFANGSLVLKLDNQPACTSTSLACSNQAYASGEYKSLSTISHGRLTFRAKPAQGSGVVTGLFTYTGTSGTASHDEIDIEFLGKDTTGVQFNYFVAGVGGHEFWLPLGFDAALALHDYSIEWLPNAINWYVDGVLKHTVNAAAGVTLPSRPQNIFMNLWASTGVNAWTGLFVYSVPISAEVSQISYKPKATAAFARFLNGATATDNVGVVGDITNNAPVTLPVGTTTVTFTATDAAGNQGTATSTVTVNAYIPPDTIKPVIAINGVNPATVEAGQNYVDALATVTDNVDPTNAVLAGVSTVNTASIGSYTVTYNTTDAAGNAATPVIRTVHVVDTTNPVLTLPANAVANATGIRTTVAIGTATATDLFAVTITNNAPFNFPIGTTQVTWTATDANGRVSTGIQQVTVNTVSTAPAVTLNNGSTVSLTAPVGETVFQVAGAAAPLAMPAGVNFPFGTLAYSVTSPFGGSVTMALAFSTPLPAVFTLYKVDNAGVVTTMPASAWTKSGAKTIQLTLTDGGAFDLDGLQNSVIVDPIAIGVDTQAPVITLTGANPVTIAQGSIFTDPGTSVTDNVDTGLVATVTGTVNTATVGAYRLTYHVKDLTGNAAIAKIRTVNVTDQTKPVVTAPANITVAATSSAGIAKTYTAIAASLNGATATDNVGVVGAITNNVPVTLPVGTTTVTFTATDAAGNQGAATSTVTVNAYIPPDTIKPVIAINGVNPITVAQGSTYLDGGSVVTDNVDTGLIAKLTGKVNTAAVGTYTLTYNATDKSGNKAVAKIRTVQVVASMQWGNTKGSLIKQPILNAGNDLILKLKGGSGNYSLVRVKGPNGYTGTLIANSLGNYVFTAPSTGAFAGNYILSMKDQATKQLLSITVRVPLKIKASRLNILESQTNQTLTIYGGLAADVFKVEVLNVSVVGKPKPDTGINAIAANIANITATTQAAKGNPAVAIVVPSNVVGIVPFKVRVTDLTQTALPAVVSQRMHIVAENTLQLSVTDASSNLPIVGAKVMLRLPPSVVATAQVQTNTNAKGVAAPVLPVGQYDFDVSAKNYVSGVLKITQGKTIAAIALSPITSSVTYRGSIAVTGGYVLTAQAKVIAVDAKGNQQAVVTGKATSFNLTVDQNLFTPVRFIARDVYAMTDVITTFPVAGGSIGTFTLRAKPAPIAEASLQKDKLVSTAAAGRSVTFTANTNVLGSANGVKKILVLAKPTKQSGTAAPQTGSVTIAVNKPVIQVMKDAKGNLLSAPVVYQKLVDVYTGVERRHVAGTKPMVLDASTLDTFSMPALKTVSNITLHLPMNAFQAKTATGVPLVVKDVFTTVSGAVASTPMGKSKAQLTGGEIVVVDMVAFDAAGNVLSTDPGNGNLGKGMEIRIPLDANALMAVGSSAIAASADFASGKLVVYTAPTMVDFEAGQQMTSIGGSVTYDSTTGEVVFYVNHFSAFGVGVGVAPTPVTVAPVITPTPVKSTPAPAPTAAATGSGGGGGGGCSLMRSDPSIFDPTLWMLVLISGILLWRKEKNIEGNDA